MPYLPTFTLVKSGKEHTSTSVYTCCLKNVPISNNQKQERKERYKDTTFLMFLCQIKNLENTEFK